MTELYEDSPQSNINAGLFAQYQPAYAEHGISTIPCSTDHKKPMVGNYLRMGIRASNQLATKFTEANAIGIVTGKCNKIAVLDIDTTDQRVLDDALTRHGKSQFVVRTASGKFHAYYRYNCERRRIRPWADRPIDILGEGGFVMAAPSLFKSGQYQIIRGRLDDLANLTTMRGVDADRPVKDIASPLRGMREHDGRNKELFQTTGPVAREIHAVGGTKDQLFEVAMNHNALCSQPMGVEEVSHIVDNVWQYTIEGRNFIAGRRDERQLELKRFLDNADGFFLLEFLRVNNGMHDDFLIANELAEAWGWPIGRLRSARKSLMGRYIRQVRAARGGKLKKAAAIYEWISPPTP